MQHLQLQGVADVEGAAMHLKFWSIAQAKSLLSTAVSDNRGDLWTLNYTKAVFEFPQTPLFDGETPSPFLPLDPSDVTSRLPRAPRSPPDLVPPLFKPETEKYYYSESY